LRRSRIGWLTFSRRLDRYKIFERLIGRLQDRVLSGVLLPTTYSDIDIARLDLDAECAAANPFGGHDRGAGTGERTLP
jgi:hypothetical protein